MRGLLLFAVFFYSCLCLNGQAWEIYNTELKAEKQGNKLIISFLDNRKSISLDADSAFWDIEFEYLFIVKDDLIGIVDPWNLELIQSPKFLSLNILDGVYYLAEEEDGYYFSLPEFPIIPLSDKFQSVTRLFERKEISLGEEEAYLVQKNDNYGIIVPFYGFKDFLVKAKYDEIIPSEFRGRGHAYYLLKNDKWGAGSCQGVEVEPRYEQLSFIFGDCGSALFIAEKDGLLGLVQSYNKKPIIPLIHARIEFLKKDNSEYLLLFKQNKLSKLLLLEGINDWFIEYEPLMLLMLNESDFSYLVYRSNDETISLELTHEEIERLGLQSLDWLIIEK